MQAILDRCECNLPGQTERLRNHKYLEQQVFYCLKTDRFPLKNIHIQQKCLILFEFNVFFIVQRLLIDI